MDPGLACAFYNEQAFSMSAMMLIGLGEIFSDVTKPVSGSLRRQSIWKRDTDMIHKLNSKCSLDSQRMEVMMGCIREECIAASYRLKTSQGSSQLSSHG